MNNSRIGRLEKKLKNKPGEDDHIRELEVMFTDEDGQEYLYERWDLVSGEHTYFDREGNILEKVSGEDQAPQA